MFNFTKVRHFKYWSNTSRETLVQNQWDIKTDFIVNNKNICTGESIFLITMVHSAFQHFSNRRNIRKTWASSRHIQGKNIRTLFMVGVLHNLTLNNMLKQEAETYHDIIQGNFIDSYRNLTYKHFMTLKWITMFCNHSYFVLKSDDDTYVMISNLITFLISLQDNFHSHFICNKPSTHVHRHPKNKWYVSKLEYNNTKYPTYCEGYAYITKTETVKKLFEWSFKMKLFWIDDVYVTGLLGEKINATHITNVSPYKFRCVGIQSIESGNCLFKKNVYL